MDYLGYRVGILIDHFPDADNMQDHVMGLTDIDDKIIARANERNITPRELAQTFEVDFFHDMQACEAQNSLLLITFSLGNLPPKRVGRVTEHLLEIFTFIRGIMEKGFAYESNGSVYFDTVLFDRVLCSLSLYIPRKHLGKSVWINLIPIITRIFRLGSMMKFP